MMVLGPYGPEARITACFLLDGTVFLSGETFIRIFPILRTLFVGLGLKLNADTFALCLSTLFTCGNVSRKKHQYLNQVKRFSKPEICG